MNPIDRAKRAQVILNDPLVREFFEEFPKALYERWRNTPDPEERDKIYALQTILDAFELHFRQMIVQGEIMTRQEGDDE